ncbi:MAG: FixH family protein [Geovibrio sp.]|nr:FixH family protein [Geovibrio sp.]
MKVTVLIFLLAIITIAPSVVVGKKLFDGRVEDNSYEKGLAYDEMRDTVMEKGLKLTVKKIEQTEKNVFMDFSLGGTYRPQSLKAEVERPVGGRTLEVPVTESGEGYALSAPQLEKGYHILKLTFAVDGKEVRLKRNFYIN